MKTPLTPRNNLPLLVQPIKSDDRFKTSAKGRPSGQPSWPNSTQAPAPLFTQLTPAVGHLDGFQFSLLETVLQRTSILEL